MNDISGHVHLFSEHVSMRYPDVVVMGMKDWIRDGLIEGLKKLGESISEGLSDAYTFFLEATVLLIAGFGTPPVEIFMNGPLGLLLGGTYGLAMQILSLLVTATAVLVVIEVARRKESLRGASSVVSILGLAFFGVLFYPAYSMLDGLSRDGSLAMLEAFSQASDGESSVENLSLVALPGNLFVVAIVSILGTLMLIVVALELVVMNVAIVGIVLFYPLNYAFRQAGKPGLAQFHIATAALIAFPIAMLIMTFWLSLGVLVVGLADRFTSGAAEPIAPFVGVVMTLAGTLLCVVTPFVVFGFFYQRTVKAVGNLDSKAQAGIDILSAPELTTRSGNDRQTEHQHRVLHGLETVGHHAAQGVSQGAPVMDIARTYVATEVAKKTAASGNPYVAAAIAGWTLYKAAKPSSDEEVADE